MKHFSGMDYLRIDISGHFGLDKKLFEERIAWVHEHETVLERMEDDADDFFRYVAAVIAYREAQAGKPTGHLVGLDATASGAQILSCLLGCKIGAANTGATGNQRMDVYGVCTATMNELCDAVKDHPRADIKDAMMTFFYGSKAEPKRIFGEGTEELQAFYEATSLTCPGAAMFLPLAMSLWDENALFYQWPMPDGFTVLCKVKDYEDAKIEVDTIERHPTFIYRHEINTTLEKGLFIPANVTHSIDGYIMRELVSRCDYDLIKLKTAQTLLIKRIEQGRPVRIPNMIPIEELWLQHQMISLEGVEYVNHWSVNQMSIEYCKDLLSLVRKCLKYPSFKVVGIHDEFKCHPNYMNYVRQIYIDLLAELADGNVMNIILSAIAGRTIEVDKLSNDLSIDILLSEYPLS